MGFPPLGPGPVAQASARENGASLEARMAAHEKRELMAALAEGGTYEEIARRLEITRKTLYLKLRAHGLNRPDEAAEG